MYKKIVYSLSKYMYKKIVFSLLTVFERFFFTDPDFSGSDSDFWPIRFRTQEKKSDPDPDKRTRIRNTDTYEKTH